MQNTRKKFSTAPVVAFVKSLPDELSPADKLARTMERFPDLEIADVAATLSSALQRLEDDLEREIAQRDKLQVLLDMAREAGLSGSDQFWPALVALYGGERQLHEQIALRLAKPTGAPA
jgi:hypothetical protein